MAIYAGKNARIAINSVYYKFKNWQIEIEDGEIDITNFESPDDEWREFLDGFSGGTLTASGCHDNSLALPAKSADLPFIAQIAAGVSITGNIRRRGLTIGQDIESHGQLTIRGRITGTPTLV